MPDSPTTATEHLISSTQGTESFDAKVAAAPRVGDAGALAGTFLMPPQGSGAPQRLYSTGSPASQQRLNVAMKVLHDPVARASFSRAYSGQTRNWNQ